MKVAPPFFNFQLLRFAILAMISTTAQSRLHKPYAIINGCSLRVREFTLCEAPYILKRRQKLAPTVG
jgi:hypothetical protein